MLSITLIRNIYRISKSVYPESDAQNIDELKLKYRLLLKLIQPDVPVNFSSSLIVNDESLVSWLSRDCKFIGPTYKNDIQDKKINLVKIALDELFQENHILKDLIDLSIHSIVLSSPNIINNGTLYSTSSVKAIGVIWLSVTDSLKIHDIKELIVHETIHNILFIDEIANRHYNLKPEYVSEHYALTAISSTLKPFDVAIHSLIVAVHILNYRKICLFDTNKGFSIAHPSSREIHKNIFKSYRSLVENPNCNKIVRENILELLDAHMRFLIQ